MTTRSGSLKTSESEYFYTRSLSFHMIVAATGSSWSHIKNTYKVPFSYLLLDLIFSNATLGRLVFRSHVKLVTELQPHDSICNSCARRNTYPNLWCSQQFIMIHIDFHIVCLHLNKDDDVEACFPLPFVVLSA